jgi:hypothetical protein
MSVLLWALIVLTQYGNTRYRIFWDDGEIKQIGTDRSVTVIDVSEITHIDRERSSVSERLLLRRPMDRIAIYGGRGERAKRIDVSMRHFMKDDIRTLIKFIHERRPELIVPTI